MPFERFGGQAFQHNENIINYSVGSESCWVSGLLVTYHLAQFVVKQMENYCLYEIISLFIPLGISTIK